MAGSDAEAVASANDAVTRMNFILLPPLTEPFSLVILVAHLRDEAPTKVPPKLWGGREFVREPRPAPDSLSGL